MERAAVRFEIKADASGDPGTFSGYGAVFGNLDSYRDVIAKGAFRDTLRDWKKRGKLPKMLCQHGGWGMGVDDMLPIGLWTGMKEDDVGLYCEGRLFALETERGRYIYEGMKSGALDGLSIGYDLKEFTLGTKPEEPRRTLKKIDLWEVSPVTFPANDKALIDAVKAAGDPDFKKNLERFLRDAGGCSRTEAKRFISEGFKAIGRRDDDAVGTNGLLDALKGVNAAFR